MTLKLKGYLYFNVESYKTSYNLFDLQCLIQLAVGRFLFSTSALAPTSNSSHRKLYNKVVTFAKTQIRDIRIYTSNQVALLRICNQVEVRLSLSVVSVTCEALYNHCSLFCTATYPFPLLANMSN